MEEPYWLPRTAEEYLQQVAEDSGPQPDETALLQRDIDAAEAEVARLTALLAERDVEIKGLVLTTRSDREYAEMKQRAEEAERQVARLVSERDVYRDSLLLISRGVWTARNSVESIVWSVREALKKGAALAARGD